MPYWEITPHHDSDYDSCIMPGETEDDHRSALEYAKDRLESVWDASAWKECPVSVTIELHKGPMPDTPDDEDR